MKSAPLRILNLNISCSKPWNDKSAHLKELVDRLKPDVVCVQELAQNFALDSPRYNQEERVKEMLGATESYSMITHPYLPEGDRASQNCLHGPGIFIVNPAVSVSAYCDIKIYQGNDRAYYNVAAQLQFQGKEVTLVNVHLSAEHRQQETAATLEWLNANSCKSVIICGDFNPHDSWDPAVKDVDDVMRDSCVDAWRLLRPSDSPETYFSTDWWVANFPNAPETAKKLRSGKTYPTEVLDYFFFSGVKALKIDKFVEVIPDLSDHASLLAEFIVD